MAILPHSPGIYKITCTPTGKVYIGSSNDVSRRCAKHISELRCNSHYNHYLQRAWNKHGESSFVFDVLELVMFAEHLSEREQYWLDTYQAYNPDRGYNKAQSAAASFLGLSHSEEAREKIRKSAREKMTPERQALMEERRRPWQASAAGRDFYKQISDRATDELRSRQPTQLVCEYCGGAFETRTRGKARFCSISCKVKARWASGVDNEERSCAYCGALFKANRWHKTIYCSRSCANRGRR